jgi:putative membrane protein
MHWDGGFGYLPFTILIGNLLFIGLIVLAVVLVVRAFNRPGPPTARRAVAEQILAERFARGEIDAEEYQARLRTLRGE